MVAADWLSCKGFPAEDCHCQSTSSIVTNSERVDVCKAHLDHRDCGQSKAYDGTYGSITFTSNQ